MQSKYSNTVRMYHTSLKVVKYIWYPLVYSIWGVGVLRIDLTGTVHTVPMRGLSSREICVRRVWVRDRTPQEEEL